MCVNVNDLTLQESQSFELSWDRKTVNERNSKKKQL